MKHNYFYPLCYKLFFLLIIVCFLLPQNVVSQPLSLDQPLDSIVDLTPHLNIYVDKTAHLGLDFIKLRLEQGDFIPANEVELEGKFQRGKYRYWFHFSLQNAHPTDSLNAYLSTNVNDTIHLYRFQNDTLREEIIAGWEMPNYRSNSFFLCLPMLKFY